MRQSKELERHLRLRLNRRRSNVNKDESKRGWRQPRFLFEPQPQWIQSILQLKSRHGALDRVIYREPERRSPFCT
jgi:hypothetical protein